MTLPSFDDFLKEEFPEEKQPWWSEVEALLQNESYDLSELPERLLAACNIASTERLRAYHEWLVRNLSETSPN